jgi:hypothetical protein
MSAGRGMFQWCAAGISLLAACLFCGCATPALDAARYQFYSGQIAQAEQRLAKVEAPDTDRVLVLMERGMIRQANGQYEDSTRDFIAAADLLERLETYSVSKGAASLVVNDMTQDFRGAPYERTLLHVFTAVNHLLLARWDDAAVEARRIIKSLDPQNRGDYPEDAFSRYMAGFCLEMIGDDSNAALQYRLANKHLSGLVINPATGHLLLGSTTNLADDGYSIPGDTPWDRELICFIFLGRSPTGRDVWSANWSPGFPVYAEIVHNEKVLGRSYNLTDTAELAFTTAQMEAVRKAAKTVSRVVLKEVIAEAVAKQTDSEAMGELVRLILLGLLEQPDIRRWETLPRWLQVARVPVPSSVDAFDVVIRNPAGVQLQKIRVEKTVANGNRIYVAICRDVHP